MNKIGDLPRSGGTISSEQQQQVKGLVIIVFLWTRWYDLCITAPRIFKKNKH